MDAVSFAASSFSVYAVVGDGSTADEARATVNFYGKDTTTPVATVYVKNSDTAEKLVDIVYDPGAGTLDNDDLFRGWSISTKNTTDGSEYSIDTEAKNIEEVRAYLESLEIAEGDVINIYAMVFDAYNIQYKDEDGVTVHSETLITKNGQAVPYTINQSYTPKSQDAMFEGWYVTTGTDKVSPAAGETVTAPPYPLGTALDISGNVIFSADPAEGHWLSFVENGSGVSYTPPQFVKSGQTTTQPSNPVRLGYVFGGWYDNPECTGSQFVFGGEIEQRTTLYAKWTPNPTADYTVIIWKQNITADGYDFERSIRLNGASNTTVNTISQQGTDNGAYARISGTNYQYEGFHLGRFDQNVTITPEGNTVVNVYYDRNQYTLRFFYARSYTSNYRTYVQVNCNNEGFLQGRRYNRNLNASLTYRGSNDYQLLGGSNTWKDVNNNSINGNAQNLVTSLPAGATYGTLGINNVWTDVVTGAYNSTARQVDMTYYYFDIPVRYEQSLDELWPVPNETFASQTMTSYNRSNAGYTTISPLLQGSWATANNIGGKYGTMTSDLFVGDDSTAYFITYWRYENHYQYQYNVYFSALDGETPDVIYDGNGYVLQRDKSYVVANGQGWGSNAPTDSGQGYWDVGTVTFDGTTKAGRVDVRLDGTINAYYDRVTNTINYNDGIYVDGDGNQLDNKYQQPIHQVTGIPFETDLASYNEGGEDYYVPTAPDGYVFEGWYLDPEGTIPYTFTSMPQKDIKVYAKWRQIEYRVFMHPNVPSNDTSLDWGGQSMCFRVDYGAKIADGNQIMGTRDEYELIGWYTDEDCTIPFNFDAYELNNSTVTTLYDQTQPTEVDKWGNPTDSTNRDAANNRTWITRKLDLYAKWRAKLVGAKGINVTYVADGRGVDETTGHEVDITGDNAPTDPLFYLDQAEAVAQAASTPDDDEYQFLYWVVQTWDETTSAYVDTGVHVYPGDTFTVLKDNARRTANPNPTGEDDQYIYTVQLRPEYGPKSEPTPTHITWYDNFTENPVEGTNYITDANLQINEAVSIEPANRFTRPGYTFIGWARVDTTNADGTPISGYTLSPQDLDEDDLFLKYEGGVFKAQVDGEWTTVTEVAADEVYPYHDLYAVWVKSWTVTIEKVVANGTEEDEASTKTFNIGYVVSDGRNDTLVLPHGGSDTVADVMTDSTVTVTESPGADFDVTYSAVRTTDSNGTELAEHVTVSPTETSTFAITGDTTITVTNTRKTTSITIVKTDDKAQPTQLTGAQFDLTRKNDQGNYVALDDSWSGITVGEETVSFLPAGDYRLTETKAPDGYVVATSTVDFTVAIGSDDKAVITLANGTTIARVDQTDTDKIYVLNTAGQSLPSTGGPGTRAFTITGLSLVAAGLVGGCWLRRRREGRSW